MPSVLAITLARGGSKRIPRKNMALINGVPLLGHTIREVQRSEMIEDYIVSSDDLEILSYAEKCEGVTTHIRSSDLAEDSATSAAALIGAMRPGYDYIAEIMCTNPLKDRADIDTAIKKAIDLDVDCLASVTPVYDHHPSRVKYIDGDVLKDFYPEPLESRRQDLTPKAYVRNGSIYVMKTKFLLEHRTRTASNNTAYYIMPEERSINIDEPNDLLLARAILEKRHLEDPVTNTT